MLRSILVPLDGSALAERALPIACDLARRGNGVVHLVRVHQPFGLTAASTETIVTPDVLAADDDLRERVREKLARLAHDLADEWGVAVDSSVPVGVPGPMITESAIAVGAHLIVMTTHGASGFAPGWFGSVADNVIRHSHRPVLVIPSNDAHQGVAFVPRRIMVPLDGSARADGILQHAQDFALLFGSQLDLVRVVTPYIPGDMGVPLPDGRPDPFGLDEQADLAKKQLAGVVANLEAQGLVAHSTVRVHPWPATALFDHIRETDPDCVALATQGRGLSRLLVGSVADKLIRTCARPVLVISPQIAQRPR